MAFGVFLLGLVRIDTPIGLVVLALTMQGLGFGLCAVPTVVAGMNELAPRFLAQAAAVRTLISQVAAATTIAVLSTVVSARMGDDPSPEHSQASYDTAFLVMSAGLLVALACATRLPRRPSTVDVGVAAAVAD
jgi:hypothetical protein